MPVGFPSNSLPNPLEKFAKADSWNSYISATKTTKPEEILENGFTEVGLVTRILEALKEAFGYESSRSSKALGERLINVIDVLKENKVELNEQCLTTLVTLAKRAKVFGNTDEKKDYQPLANRLTVLNAEVKQLQALITSGAEKTSTSDMPKSEEDLDLFTLQDDSSESEDVIETPELPVVVDSTKTEDTAQTPKEAKDSQETRSSPAFGWKGAKFVFVAAVITAGASLANRWNAGERSSSTALVPLRETCHVSPQCDLDELAKTAAKATSAPEDDPGYGSPKFQKFQMLSETLSAGDYTGVNNVWNWASYNIQHRVVEPFEELLYPESCSPEYSGSEATMMADQFGNEHFITTATIDSYYSARFRAEVFEGVTNPVIATKDAVYDGAAAISNAVIAKRDATYDGVSRFFENTGNIASTIRNAAYDDAAAIGNAVIATKDAMYYVGSRLQPKGVVFAEENRRQYNVEATKIAARGVKRVRENPLNEYDPAIKACHERHDLKLTIRNQGTQQANWFAESLDWMRHGTTDGASCEQLWTECEKVTNNSTQTANLLVAKSGRPNKGVNGLSQAMNWVDYSLEVVKQNGASLGQNALAIGKDIGFVAQEGVASLYRASAKKIALSMVKLINGPSNSVV